MGDEHKRPSRPTALQHRARPPSRSALPPKTGARRRTWPPKSAAADREPPPSACAASSGVRSSRPALLLSGCDEKSCRRSLWTLRLSVRSVSTWRVARGARGAGRSVIRAPRRTPLPPASAKVPGGGSRRRRCRRQLLPQRLAAAATAGPAAATAGPLAAAEPHDTV